MASKSDTDVIVGIILVVLGVLLLVGTLKVPMLALLIAVAMVAAGALLLLGKLKGPQWLGIVLLALGVFLLLPLPISEGLADNLASIASLLGAVALVLFGLMKALHKV